MHYAIKERAAWLRPVCALSARWSSIFRRLKVEAKTRASQTVHKTQEKDEAVIYMRVLSYSAIGILSGNTSSRAQLIP